MPRFSDLEVDEATLNAARRGDPRAQEGIYRRFSGPVFNLARRLLGGQAQAEEVLQDTFVEVLTGLDTYRGEAPFAFWIRRIAVNKCLMTLRSPWHSRRSSLELEDDSPAAGEALAREGFNPCRMVDHVALERALAGLSDTSRLVVWLHDVEGYTHGEIADQLGRTASYSKSRLARAHARLQALLDNESVTEPCMQASNNC
jgi:RNA polymerase sigma factor (sigma-70 family)